MPTRNLVLTLHQENLIETLVQSGRYHPKQGWHCLLRRQNDHLRLDRRP